MKTGFKKFLGGVVLGLAGLGSANAGVVVVGDYDPPFGAGHLLNGYSWKGTSSYFLQNNACPTVPFTYPTLISMIGSPCGGSNIITGANLVISGSGITPNQAGNYSLTWTNNVIQALTITGSPAPNQVSALTTLLSDDLTIPTVGLFAVRYNMGFDLTNGAYLLTRSCSIGVGGYVCPVETTQFSKADRTTYTTVPEPGTLLLMALGLLGAGAVRRAKKSVA